jgi:hypothetical protein
MTGIMQGLASFVEEMWNMGGFGKIIAIFVTLMIFAIAVLVALAVLALIGWAYEQIVWLKNRQQCIHCDNWTTAASKGEYAECPQGQVCCSSCTFKHFMTHEPKLACLVCGTTMDKKSIKDKVVADICPAGHGTWLATDELDIVKQFAYDEGYEDGKSDGTATGLAIGIAT